MNKIKQFLALLLVFFTTFTYAQYCVTGCNDNAYINSVDPNTIEYDNMVSGFHASLVKEVDGTFKIWGQGSGANATDLLSPTAIVPTSSATPATNFVYTGTPLKATMGSYVASGNVIKHQFALLTTTGLYIWGQTGTLVSTTVKGTTAFGAVSIGTIGITGTNSQGLPDGVTPDKVKMMFGSQGTLGIVTCTGEAWILSSMGGKKADGTSNNNDSDKWVPIQTAASTPLTNVVAMRGTPNAMVALTSDGKMYTWGANTYTGASSDSYLATRTYATLMTLPSGKTPKMIGMTQSTSNAQTYYLVTTDNNLYSLGNNTQKQLGDWNGTTASTTWVQPTKPNAAGTASSGQVFNDVVWISPNEHDGYLQAAINILTSDKKQYAWGSNSGMMIGGATNNTNYDPIYMPGKSATTDGLSVNDAIIAVETGGHTSMNVKQCSQKFGYVGHKTNGSMGDNDNGTGNPNTYSYATAVLVVCGANTTPSVKAILKKCSGTTADLSAALLSSPPTGNTIEWWTTLDRQAGTQVTNPSAVNSGTYYAFYIPSTGLCTAPTGVLVTVSDFLPADPHYALCNTGTLPCNTEIPWVNGGGFSALKAKITNNVGSLIPPCLGAITNVNNLVDPTLSNFAQIDITGIACSGTMSAYDDSGIVYPAGAWAGFKISTTDLIGASIGATVTVSTYYNGVFKESQVVSSSLIAANILSGNTANVGFTTTKDFNDIRITYKSLLGVLFTGKVYYPIIRKFCAGPVPDCNVTTPLSQNTYPALVSQAGVTGLTLGSVSNADNVVDSNNNNSATIILPVGILASGYIAVKDQITTYPAGYFAGFEISNTTLIGLSALSNSTITTYLNGVQQEEKSSNNLFLEAPILSGTGRQVVGFNTTLPFDEIKYTIKQTGIDVGVTNVYNAVIKRYCAGPALPCNTEVAMTTPLYPVSIDGSKTGIDGIACVGCSISNTENIINATTTDWANVTLLAGAGISGSVAVVDAVTDYAAGTFVGFDIYNTTLLDVSLLNGITLRTYLNGVLQETKTGTAQLISAGTSILTDDGRRTVGFITAQPFDEARITLTNFLGADLGTTRIYKMVTKKFCAVPMVCDQTYFLSEPDFPVVVNGAKTGIVGVACVACSVADAPNVISPSKTDHATITVVAGIAASGNIAVQDGANIFPVGSTAGFVIQDMNSLLQLDLFNSLTVCTYLNGTLQECKTGGDLIDLALLTNWIGMGPGKYNLGFKTTKPYNEIRLSVASLASLINVINVYSAFVDTREATGPGWNCITACFNDPVLTGNGPDTKVGITLLKRAGAQNADNWPMVRKSGHIALESNTQGFVINRLSATEMAAIKTAGNAVDGMMVFDTTNKCLSIYDGTDWKCFDKAACP